MGNVFQSNCSSYAKLRTNLRKIEKWPKIQQRTVMHSALQIFKLNPLKFTVSISFDREFKGAGTCRNSTLIATDSNFHGNEV